MKNKIFTIAILILTSFYQLALGQTIINMEKEGGVFTLPCTVNGLKLKFIFDTGASDVSISLTEALFMFKNGYLKSEDIVGTGYYQDASGKISVGTKIILNSIEFSGFYLHNVEASVVNDLSAPLLLGQSAMTKLGTFQLNPSNGQLTIINGASNNSNTIDAISEVVYPFSGVIELTKTSTIDATDYIYYVSNDNVRIDELASKSSKAAGTFLIDLKAKTMKTLNHKRKYYMNQPTQPAPVMNGGCGMKTGTNTKTILGIICNEYIVTNLREGTIITYYLADSKYSFYEKLLRLMNRQEKASIYFLQIPDFKNAFPMLSIKTDLSGKEIGRVEVTKIVRKGVAQNMFEIPRNYAPFEK